MQQDPTENYGFVIHGDANGPMAAGRNAMAVQHTGTAGTVQLTDVLARLRETRRWIEENRAAVAEPDEAVRDVDQLVELVQTDQPDRRQIRERLGRLVDRLSVAGGIAGGAAALQELVNQFLA